MRITHETSAPNGAELAYHRVVKVLLEGGVDYLQVLVHSWPSESSYLAAYPEIWRTHHLIPLVDLDLELGFREAVLAALIALPEWTGGTPAI